MCGISGIYFLNNHKAQSVEKNLQESVKRLKHRGPDDNGLFFHENAGLGHTRLAVIDTSSRGKQPMQVLNGRYTIVFNGEFYNFRQEKKKLQEKGYHFFSDSDTEVLVILYAEYGKDCLKYVNGCFALAIYDKEQNSLFIARDRMGIKPLYYYQDHDKLVFASELRSITAFNISKKIDKTSLFNYFQFNYIPGPFTIFKDVKKLNPGTYLFISGKRVMSKEFYKLPQPIKFPDISYDEAKRILRKEIDNSVQKRLIADVPIGVFLSGGIDSSVITATASKFTKNLNTFSIGYKDNQFFDETHYATMVAHKFNTNHTVFQLTNQDLLYNIDEILTQHIDEPFADSSAIAVYTLSKLVKSNITVALSGDGADEIFSGYKKHRAHLLASKQGFYNFFIRNMGFLTNFFPKSRNNKFANAIRSFEKYHKGLRLSPKERYWLWASILTEDETFALIKSLDSSSQLNKRKTSILKHINTEDINEILYTDTLLVLQNDMLPKVDSMSMANGLEVRTPLLDHNIVDFLFTLPPNYKITKTISKRILQDAYSNILPSELYNRPKHGFEVPLTSLLRTIISNQNTQYLFSQDFIHNQNLFNFNHIQFLLKSLFSNNLKDTPYTIWALLVFQHWWIKNCI